jgi:hypothetical protein
MKWGPRGLNLNSARTSQSQRMYGVVSSLSCHLLKVDCLLVPVWIGVLFKWLCPVSSPVTCFSWFLFSRNNSLVLLADDSKRKLLVCVWIYTDFTSSILGGLCSLWRGEFFYCTGRSPSSSESTTPEALTPSANPPSLQPIKEGCCQQSHIISSPRTKVGGGTTPVRSSSPVESTALWLVWGIILDAISGILPMAVTRAVITKYWQLYKCISYFLLSHSIWNHRWNVGTLPHY